MVISDILYILQHFKLNFIPFFIVNTVVFYNYSKTSLNRTLLFQKVVRFSKISVYTKCRIAPANRTKFGLGGGFPDADKLQANPNIAQIAPRLTEICSVRLV